MPQFYGGPERPNAQQLNKTPANAAQIHTKMEGVRQ